MQVTSSNTNPSQTNVLYEEMEKKISKDDFKKLVKLGDSHRGVVYTATWKKITDMIAVKAFHDSCLPDYRKCEYNDYFGVPDHPNLITRHGICDYPGKHALLMELMQTSLDKRIEHYDTTETKMPFGERNYIAVNVARGVAFLHSHDVIHGELKSPNVLLNFLTGGKIDVKLSDFASPFRKESRSLHGHEKPLAVRWQIHDSRRTDKEYCKTCDVYSLSLVIWEMFAMRIPFPTLTQREVFQKLNSNEREIVPTDCLPIYRKIIVSCWGYILEERPTSEKVHVHLNKFKELDEKVSLVPYLPLLSEIVSIVKELLFSQSIKELNEF